MAPCRRSRSRGRHVPDAVFSAIGVRHRRSRRRPSRRGRTRGPGRSRREASTYPANAALAAARDRRGVRRGQRDEIAPSSEPRVGASVRPAPPAPGSPARPGPGPRRRVRRNRRNLRLRDRGGDGRCGRRVRHRRCERRAARAAGAAVSAVCARGHAVATAPPCPPNPAGRERRVLGVRRLDRGDRDLAHAADTAVRARVAVDAERARIAEVTAMSMYAAPAGSARATKHNRQTYAASAGPPSPGSLTHRGRHAKTTDFADSRIRHRSVSTRRPRTSRPHSPERVQREQRSPIALAGVQQPPPTRSGSCARHTALSPSIFDVEP